MGSKRIWIGVAIAIAALLAFAWIDGGMEPKRLVVEPVEVPEGDR